MDTIAELEAIPGLLVVLRRRGKKSIYRPSFAARGKENEPYIPVGKRSTAPVDQPVDQPVDVSPTTPVDVSPTLSRGEEVRGSRKINAAAVSSFMENAGYSQAQTVLQNAAQLAYLPTDLQEKRDTVYQLIRTYGEPATTAALQEARTEWVKCKRKDNGRGYSVLNPAWVDWAVAHLAGETPWESSKPKTAIERALEQLENFNG